ncbi:MAG TPA: DUF169 domain-containing protein [Methanomicrobiales archaeon]|nr:DUF169 domain-containing protein [Methanomicrobiales archaeon]
MDIGLRDRFTGLWNTYFPGAELPIAFGLGGQAEGAEKVPAPKGWRCVVCDLSRIRRGTSLSFGEESVTCGGGKFYLGFTRERPPEFPLFLSYGKTGVVEGERYKRSPEVVEGMTGHEEHIPSAGKCYSFKRWDRLSPDDDPQVVVFFARPEVLSGLFTLANFDQTDPNGGVICPFGAGCGSIVYYPWLEQQKENPRAVLGLFDPSARPCVPVDILSMAVPMKKFVKMIGYMEESFLITPTWEKVKRKIARSAELHSPERKQEKGN